MIYLIWKFIKIAIEVQLKLPWSEITFIKCETIAFLSWYQHYKRRNQGKLNCHPFSYNYQQKSTLHSLRTPFGFREPGQNPLFYLICIL